jgi:hypothetical protein
MMKFGQSPEQGPGSGADFQTAPTFLNSKRCQVPMRKKAKPLCAQLDAVVHKRLCCVGKDVAIIGHDTSAAISWRARSWAGLPGAVAGRLAWSDQANHRNCGTALLRPVQPYLIPPGALAGDHPPRYRNLFPSPGVARTVCPLYCSEARPRELKHRARC